MNFNVLIPLLAKVVLHKESKEYGFLMSFMGAGSFLGAFSQVIKSRSGPKKYLLYSSAVISSIVLMLVGFSKSFVLDSMLLFLVGFFNIRFSTTANSTMQLKSSD
ncbi:MFS transporter [Clostridium sp. DJ247]|uniref:MFS transporter n=1 Tax=Clostridium sp. DJ247 TaxID=2726188 RepID=UPI001F4CAE54|nr:MFS transporter [Clostridium sp. DJ247]